MNDGFLACETSTTNQLYKKLIFNINLILNTVK